MLRMFGQSKAKHIYIKRRKSSPLRFKAVMHYEIDEIRLRPYLVSGKVTQLTYLNTNHIYFSQPTIGLHFTDGRTINDLIKDLEMNFIQPENIPLIRVVWANERFYSLDNRRLSAYKSAGIKKIPVELVSLSDNYIANCFNNRFNPIYGIGKYIVISTYQQRKETLKLLHEQNVISKPYSSLK